MDKGLLDALRSGYPVVVAEYRGGTSDDIKWVDKRTGKAMEATVFKFGVELVRESGEIVAVRCSCDPELVEKGLSRGDMVYMILRKWEFANGAESCRPAKVCKLTAAVGKGA